MLLSAILCGCASSLPTLDYHESFAVSAFNELNGKLGYGKGYTLTDAKYAYVTPQQLELSPTAFEGMTDRQKYYFSQIYCCVELTVLINGQTEKYVRYFSISSYDFTPELDGCMCLDLLYAKLQFTRMDISKLTRYLS